MTSLDQLHADAMAELDAADEADEIANRMFNSDEERAMVSNGRLFQPTNYGRGTAEGQYHVIPI